MENASQSEYPHLDDVLEWLVAEEERPTNAVAGRWMGRFPCYREEIAEFVVSWAVLNILPAEQTIRALEEDEIVLMRTTKVDELLREHGH